MSAQPRTWLCQIELIGWLGRWLLSSDFFHQAISQEAQQINFACSYSTVGHWGLPTSAALSAQSLTILTVLVSVRPSVVICSFHEPEQLGSVGGAFSSQLQLSGTHCHFTFAPRPSVAARSQFQAGLKTHLFRLAFHWLFLWELLKRLNWPELRPRLMINELSGRLMPIGTVDCRYSTTVQHWAAEAALRTPVMKGPFLYYIVNSLFILQCFDAVGWAAGRSSTL